MNILADKHEKNALQDESHNLAYISYNQNLLNFWSKLFPENLGA